MPYLFSNYNSQVFSSQDGAVDKTKIYSFKQANAPLDYTITSEVAIATTQNPNLVVSFPQDPNTHQPLKEGSTLVLRDVTTSRWKRVASPKSSDDHTAVYIQSVHPVGYVVDVKWEDSKNDVDVISWSKKFDDYANQIWTFPNGTYQNTPIKSAFNGLALTVVGHPARGAKISNSPIGPGGPTAAQLWNFTPHGFIQLASAPQFVLTLPVDATGKPLPPVFKQEAVLTLEDLSLSLWHQVPSTKPDVHYYQTYNPVGYVIDIANEVEGEHNVIIGWRKKPEGQAFNQLWVIKN